MHPYFGASVAFATKHKKELLVQQLFKDKLNISLVGTNTDTDQYGTFSGEVERKLPPLETAISKAPAGIKESGLRFGVASEGTIGNDALLPIAVSDVEIMVLVDAERDLVISESYRSFEIVNSSFLVDNSKDLKEFLLKVDFPRQKLIAKSSSVIEIKEVIKGISTIAELNSAIENLTKLNANVILEPDFRAHNCPTRQNNIVKVGELLVQRILSLCPNCQTPGFGKTNYRRGLPCLQCKNLIPAAIAAEYLTCIACDYQSPEKIIRTELDPANCSNCNP